MTRHVLRRALEAVPVLAGALVLVFSIVHLVPGDPVLLVAGMEAGPETVERTRRELGLDQPLIVQFGRYVARVARGDLGTSIRTRGPVAGAIAERVPVTVRIAVAATVLGALAGIAIGVLAALLHRRLGDGTLVVLSLLAASTPSYWLALMLMLTFSLDLGWLPSIGIGTPWHYVLPVATLAAQGMGTVARLTRTSMLDVLQQEFVRSARSRGLPAARVVVRHALGNALIPVASVIGLRFGGLLAGTVLVESVFAIPGLGRLVVDAVLARDYPLVQGAILTLATMFVVVNMLTDIAYGALDPRIRADV